ncbi:hypothetical protein BOTBODRAFT_238243 [Botryobasidium botryosum FD-172 SS1]|uniref:Poly(A) RNA polymerase mitochondrial-like central palm domain-containing protein n=1 Tax=Botryobasidium botryosum (strain FD-172 SS1) TaxID=930990 RepID=A0A067MLR2_BOTB1|nr:hypothetical protein BOTBODRAFT_238243 [Botryobasidium botryosum FD-172 SS1]
MKHVVSIRSGGLRRRQRLPENPYRKAKPEAQESTAEQPAPAEKEAKVTAEPPSTQESEDGWVEPEEWVNAKFVVQNPFVLTYNHGSTVKGPEVDRFYSLTRVSFEKLESGMPLSSILGADLPSRHFTEPLHPSLAVDIRNLFDSMQPPTDVLNARNRTLARLKRIIQSNFGNGYDVACFGSTVYGVDSPTSDLDVVIIDKARSDGFAPAINLKRLPRIYDVLHLAAIFRREGFVKVSSVPWASVPIVKLTDPDTGLQVDINVNDQLGLCNTILLRCYCALIPSLRPLVSLIKRWAKSHGLNDPGAQNGPATFSSYCLVLMTVGLLQSKGIAPSLQQGFEDIPEGDGGFWMRTGGQGQKKKKPPGRKAEEKGKQAEGKGKQVEGGGKQMEGKVKQAGGDGNDEAVAGASTQAVKAGGAGSRGGGTRNRRRDGQGKSADGPSRRSGNANPPAKSGGENRRRTRNPKAPPASSGKAGSQRNGVGAVERGPMLNNTQAAQGQ